MIMSAITLHDAQSRLADLIHGLSPGEVLTITENDRPGARLIPVPLVQQRPPRPRPPVTGVPKAVSCEGLFVVPDDFKEPLEEMREYME
jgi:antitoxin (DNA-binding transcriptional repressor) of toxin-antitoxin stability system